MNFFLCLCDVVWCVVCLCVVVCGVVWCGVLWFCVWYVVWCVWFGVVCVVWCVVWCGVVCRHCHGLTPCRKILLCDYRHIYKPWNWEALSYVRVYTTLKYETTRCTMTSWLCCKRDSLLRAGVLICSEQRQRRKGDDVRGNRKEYEGFLILNFFIKILQMIWESKYAGKPLPNPQLKATAVTLWKRRLGRKLVKMSPMRPEIIFLKERAGNKLQN